MTAPRDPAARSPPLAQEEYGEELQPISEDERQQMLIAGGWVQGDLKEIESKAREQRAQRRQLRIEQLQRFNPYLAAFVILLFLPLLAVGLIQVTDDDDITSNDEFFTLSIADTPSIDVLKWHLPVNGFVENELNLTYDNLTGLNSTWAVVKLKCVSGPSGTANWSGILLSDLLNMARPNATSKEVVFYAADGYSSSLTLEEAYASNVILAYEMNGETLPPDHGFPLRLVVPDKYGYKWVKWIERIEVVDYDYKGYWESRGWNDEAEVAAFNEFGPHALLMSIGFILCGLALVSGLKQSRFKGLTEIIPDHFTEQRHRLLSLAFIGLFLLTFLWWSVKTHDYRGDLFYTFHGRLALMSVIFFLLGASARFTPEPHQELGRRLHRNFNQLGFMFLAVIILTGLGLIT